MLQQENDQLIAIQDKLITWKDQYIKLLDERLITGTTALKETLKISTSIEHLLSELPQPTELEPSIIVITQNVSENNDLFNSITASASKDAYGLVQSLNVSVLKECEKMPYNNCSAMYEFVMSHGSKITNPILKQIFDILIKDLYNLKENKGTKKQEHIFAMDI